MSEFPDYVSIDRIVQRLPWRSIRTERWPNHALYIDNERIGPVYPDDTASVIDLAGSDLRIKELEQIDPWWLPEALLWPRPE